MKRFILATLIVLLYTPIVFGLPGVKQWKAVWNANTESDLAGYFLYWKVLGGEFTDTDRIDCGINTEYSLGGVPNNTILAVTAYDTSGNEGGFSSEVPFDQDSTSPAVVDGLSVVEELE